MMACQFEFGQSDNLHLASMQGARSAWFEANRNDKIIADLLTVTLQVTLSGSIGRPNTPNVQIF